MLNRAVLMGRLTTDPELRQTPNGISVLSFSIAVDRTYGGKNGERQTDFINLVAWRQTAEFISRYFSKGQMIAVDGSIQTRNYTDKQGNNRTAFEVVVDNASFCGSKAESGGVSRPVQQASNTPNFKEPASQGESFSVGDFNDDDFGDFEELGTDDSKLPF